jgi:16S rRNA (guanine(527)-N(7))-methyltransferase RsmG
MDRSERLVKFRELMVAENEKQNLTKLTSPEDFYFGHVLDVQKLLSFERLQFPAVDLGSGCGVPGLLAAIVSDDHWVLAESEGRKAAFLQDAVRELGLLDRVEVQSQRAERWLGGLKQPVGCIVARAVGPLDRIYGWLKDCSTWNTLVLFKGPGWGGEWESFSSGAHRGRLVVKESHEYTAGPEKKVRVIVRLERVPRGTIRK